MLKSLLMKFFTLIELLTAFIKWKMISRVKRGCQELHKCINEDAKLNYLEIFSLFFNKAEHEMQ
jgi:hypothetical protein